ncbi:cilia- and flagella-associated protein 206 [Bombyx mori]|uniref:Cilia- and flagella-associated protein 206 n=1 Tax=Bombyx mori TaxID=7091 RepID=A0A8R1WPE1_BOMMO|nr:cilia- and flagella-associated protein 206 isoform X1 [Bombyx mori]
MACNENVVKNIANEVARECQSQNVAVDPDFVIYLIDLLLLNPKYGKLFTKTINRNNLQFFVGDCVDLLIRDSTSIKTLKMQFTIQTNYDKLQNLIDKHLDSIDNCLRPLVNEILDEEPNPDDEAQTKKLFRKISIFIILASGLGNPGVIITLKEGMAALESVFSWNDLKMFVALPRNEKLTQLNELMEIVSGVRIFNRDCKKGGEGIPDLPFDLVDAGKACLTAFSNSLITVMQRVNTLTTAIEDTVVIQDETGNVLIDVRRNSGLSNDDYNEIFQLLAFNRQYEVFTRKLLCDVETMLQRGAHYVDRVKKVLEELHDTVKYKTAVPTVTVYPLFAKLWQTWRAMQNTMYLVSTANRLMSVLTSIQEQTKIPYNVLDIMLSGKEILSDQERMCGRISMEDRLSLGALKNYVAYDSFSTPNDRYVQFLGFCAVCLGVGALIPSNMKIGLIKCQGRRYGFCSVKMAAKFSKDPQRYVNEVLEYARNNPHVINLLNIVEDAFSVKDIDNLITKHEPKTKVSDKDIQTETHPIEEHIERNYSWDLWEWKRRACKWATIVNSRTHSTQTDYSHLRSEIHCQTFENRDKSLQTMKSAGINTIPNKVFVWGLRGRIGDGQHAMNLGVEHNVEKKKEQTVSVCTWPCAGYNRDESTSTGSLSDEYVQFYKPDLVE